MDLPGTPFLPQAHGSGTLTLKKSREHLLFCHSPLWETARLMAQLPLLPLLQKDSWRIGQYLPQDLKSKNVFLKKWNVLTIKFSFQHEIVCFENTAAATTTYYYYSIIHYYLDTMNMIKIIYSKIFPHMYIKERHFYTTASTWPGW